jgi:F0F1-type ATP synthase membrane subunit a
LLPESNHQTAGQKPLSAHISHMVTQVFMPLGPQILLYFLFYFIFIFFMNHVLPTPLIPLLFLKRKKAISAWIGFG